MTKVKPGWRIPDDWTEIDGHLVCLFCIPNSRQWRAIINGLVESLSYGRNWNRQTGSIKDTQRTGIDIFESLSMACIEDLITSIEDITAQLVTANTTLLDLASLPYIADIIKSCCNSAKTTGQDVDDPPSIAPVSTGGPNDQFANEAQYFSAKCNVANAIYDTLLGTVTWLKNNNVDLIAGATVGSYSMLIGALLAAGPGGWGIAAVGATVIGILTLILRSTGLNFTDIESALTEQHADLICSLFNSQTADDGRDGFLDTLDDATTSITTIERSLVAVMLNSKLLNNLFSPRSDMQTYTSDNPISCATCSLTAILAPHDEANGDSGIIVGSNAFDVSDTVTVQSIPDPDCSGRHYFYMSIWAGGAPLQTTVTTVTTGWVEYSALDACPDNQSTYYDALAAPGAIILQKDSSTLPDVSLLATVQSIVLRSGSPFTTAITRNS